MPVLKKQEQKVQEFRTVDDMRDFYMALNNMQGNGEEIALSFNIGHYSQYVCDRIVDVAEKTTRVGFKPHVTVFNNNLEFTVDELYEFIDCEEQLKKGGVELYFDDASNLYTVDETLMAFEKMKKVVNEINAQGTSPFEKLLLIYQYVTGFVYRENEQQKANARELISILNSDDIVCVGYAKLIEYMCDAVGIKCIRGRSDLFDKEDYYVGSHQTNLIYIEDEKYGIKGYFHLDACFDSIKEENNAEDMCMNYNFCLIPLIDIEHMPKRFVFYEKAEAFYNHNQAELFYNYFSDPEKVKKLMKYHGVSFASKSAELKMTHREYGEKKQKALDILNRLFNKYNIYNNIYMTFSKVPDILKLESLMALCFDYEKNKDVVEFCMEQLAEHMRVFNAYEGSVVSKNNYPIGNVYARINGYKTSQATDTEIKAMKVALSRTARLNAYFDFTTKAREEYSAPDLEDYKIALERVFVAQGASREDARGYATKAIKHTVSRSVKYFDEDAVNCFRVAASEKRKQKA